MKRGMAWAGQAVLYGLFALFIGVFSQWPSYRHLPPDEALVKVSFVLHGKHVAECRKRTAQELAKMPPNMRAPMECQRERAPVRIEVDVDGVLRYAATAKPSGLSKDGASSVYHRFALPAGSHRITVRLKDSAGGGAFDYQRESQVVLKPAQILVIDFDSEKGGIALT